MRFTWHKFTRHVSGVSDDASTRITIAIDYVHVSPVTAACQDDADRCNAQKHWRGGFSALVRCGVTGTTTCVSPFPSIAKAKLGGERVARWLRTRGAEQSGRRVDETTVEKAVAAWRIRFGS